MRKHIFEIGGFYHIFNRGVDRRDIFLDTVDRKRFLQSMKEFNAVEPIGSLYEHSFIKSKLGNPISKLVNVVAFCLNPNHFHILVEQVEDDGASTFMHRLGLGYTKYFNVRYRRSGALFQGRFKSVSVSSNEQLLHVSAYVNLNDRVHGLKPEVTFSSLDEYVKGEHGFCVKNIVLNQFNNAQEYKEFAADSLMNILEHKAGLKELEDLFLEEA